MMNIYDCFSPTILIIYRYFQFSSGRSTTEQKATPGVLWSMYNNVATSLLLPTQGWVIYHIRRLALGYRAALLSRSSRRHGASGSHTASWSSVAMCEEGCWLLKPLRLQRVAPAYFQPNQLHRAEGWPSLLPGQLPLGRESVAEDCTAWARTAILFDPSVMVQTGGIPPVSPPLLQGFLFGSGLQVATTHFNSSSPSPAFTCILHAHDSIFSALTSIPVYIFPFITQTSLHLFYYKAPYHQQKAQKQ